jgi:hypothetical protein
LTSFLVAAIPISGICFICSGESSHAREPKLRSSINAAFMLTESPEHIRQSMMQRIKLFVDLKIITSSVLY